jgi:hypothetical protein
VLAALPPGLREWVIPREQIQYVRRADGSLHALGEGASGRVFKAVLNSEVVAAKEMDIGSSLDSQRVFVTVRNGERRPCTGSPHASRAARRRLQALRACQGRGQQHAAF